MSTFLAFVGLTALLGHAVWFGYRLGQRRAAQRFREMIERVPADRPRGGSTPRGITLQTVRFSRDKTEV